MNKNWGTLVLAILASVCIFLLRNQGSSMPIWLVAETVVLISVAIAVRAWIGMRSDTCLQAARATKGRAALIIIGATMIVTPWLSKWIQTRWMGGNGEATELVWLAMLQYAAVWQAAVATQPRHEWLSFLMSCFLAIFGLATSDRNGMLQVVGPFAILAAWWLMARYWNSIAGGFVASESVPLFRMRLMVLGAMIPLSVVALWLASHRQGELAVLDGFMPTSGGKQRADASARQGIGDGDMLVAARDEAYTFGPVDSDLFLESESPSMYDLVSEIYGDSVPRQRQYARAISLESQVQESHEEGTESKKNSREFSALRRPPDGSNPVRPKGTDSRAVMYLIGQTPEWLRLESFDRFEDNLWTQSNTLDLAQQRHEPTLHEIASKPWMMVQSAPSELVYPVHERIATKVIQFKSPRILCPSLTTHLHIDRIDQPDFFGWMPDGQLMMPNREHVPQLTVIHQLQCVPQLHALRDPNHQMRHLAHNLAAHRGQGDVIGHYLHLDATATTNACETARRWLEEDGLCDPTCTTDWNRVMGIVWRLRRDFINDPTALPSEDCTNSIDFILETRRGPDYLLASTAVLMIRSLGIPCRLCRGFFASSNRYDIRSGQTEVLPEDLHTWAEVYAHGIWIPIEPTGSYPMPREHRSWQQWAYQSAWWIRDTLRQNPIATATAFLLTVATIFFRQRVLELGFSVLMLALQCLPPRARIRWTLRLLVWRMWVWGETLSARDTVDQWLSRQLRIRSSANATDREAFIRTVQRLAYAPEPIQRRWLASNMSTIRRVCWSVVLSGIVSILRRRPFTTTSIESPS